MSKQKPTLDDIKAETVRMAVSWYKTASVAHKLASKVTPEDISDGAGVFSLILPDPMMVIAAYRGLLDSVSTEVHSQFVLHRMADAGKWDMDGAGDIDETNVLVMVVRDKHGDALTNVRDAMIRSIVKAVQEHGTEIEVPESSNDNDPVRNATRYVDQCIVSQVYVDLIDKVGSPHEGEGKLTPEEFFDKVAESRR